MNIQFSSWQLIDLTTLDTAINNGAVEFDSIFDPFDGFLDFIDTATNTRVTGTWQGFQVDLRGNHYLDDVPIETTNSLSLIDATRNLFVGGSVTFNYDNGFYSGYYNRYSYTSTNITGLTNLQLLGRFNVDTLGDVAGGTATQYNVSANGYTLNITGNFNLDFNFDIVGGTITSFTFADNLGHNFIVSSLSLSALDFYNLTDPLTGHTSLNDLYTLVNDPLKLNGNDTIIADIADTQSNIINGYGGNDNLGGGGGNDTLNGGAGADTLDGGTGADNMDGGDGNDTYIVDDEFDTVTETNSAAAGGVDLVKSSLDFNLGTSGYVENLTLTGTDNINAIGNTLANTLTGNAGNNELQGEGGADKLIGGAGNDTYYVNLKLTGTAGTAAVSLEDKITEATAGTGGSDTVVLSNGPFNLTKASTITLAAGLENLAAQFTGSTLLNLVGNSANNEITGNDANNLINGKAGDDSLRGLAGNDTLNGETGDDTLDGGSNNDTLDGGKGVDSLTGGTGDDTYIVDITTNQGFWEDSLNEAAGLSGGVDTLKLRGSAIIPATSIPTNIDLGDFSAGIENLDVSLTGKTRYDLQGNGLDNILTGNATNNKIIGDLGNDVLNGGAGNDNLVGGDGNDTLIGGLGIDTFDGGIGDDTYVVDSVAEANAIEDDNGNNTLNIGLAYTLANDSPFTNLTLTGTGGVSATGNTGNNSITGNSGANTLNGNGGADTLTGGKGNDTLNGGADNDTIIGGIGNDILIGGLGVDTFVWSLADKGTNGRPSIDKITDFDITQNEVLDLRDLLIGESNASDNLLNYLNITTNASGTEIRISSTGSFASGNYSAGNTDARIVLTGIDLFSATGTGSEADLIQNLITANKLIVD